MQEGHGEEQQEWPEQQEWSDEQQRRKVQEEPKEHDEEPYEQCEQEEEQRDWDRGAAQGSLSATEEQCKRTIDQQHRRSVRGET